jgi:hypothetical protein
MVFKNVDQITSAQVVRSRSASSVAQDRRRDCYLEILFRLRRHLHLRSMMDEIDELCFNHGCCGVELPRTFQDARQPRLKA